MSSHYCSGCFARRPFVGPFDGDSFQGWGPITLGIVPLAKLLANHLAFRPVCLDCGRAVVWAAQWYLDDAHTIARTEAQNRLHRTAQPLRTGRLHVERTDASPETVRVQFEVARPVNPPSAGRRAIWEGNGGSLVRIVDHNNALVAKVPTSFSYLGPAFMLAGGERLVLFQPSIGSSHGKVSIFARTGSYIIPWRLQKWSAIAGMEHSEGFGMRDLCEPFVPDRSVVFGDSRGFGVIDAVAIGDSYFHKHRERQFYNHVSRSRTGEHIIVNATEWDDDDVASNAIKVFRTRDGHECFSVAISADSVPRPADNGTVLALAQPGAVFVYDLETGALLASVACPEPCRQLQLSGNGITLLRVDDTIYVLNAV